MTLRELVEVELERAQRSQHEVEIQLSDAAEMARDIAKEDNGFLLAQEVPKMASLSATVRAKRELVSLLERLLREDKLDSELKAQGR